MTLLIHRICNDGVIQLSSLSSYAMLEAVEISCACIVHLVLQYSRLTLVNLCQLDLNPANLEATVKAEWILAFRFLRKRHFWWRHSYIITTYCHASINGTFYTFFNNMDCQDDFCQKLPKVMKIGQSYGQNTIGAFFLATVYKCRLPVVTIKNTLFLLHEFTSHVHFCFD